MLIKQCGLRPRQRCRFFRRRVTTKPVVTLQLAVAVGVAAVRAARMTVYRQVAQRTRAWSATRHRLVNFFLISRPHFFLDFPPLFLATFIAIAILCFCDLPCSISVLMFSEITFFDEPFFSGI